MSGQGPTYQADVRFRVEGYDEVARHWKPSNESRRARQQPPLNHPQITSMLDPSVWRPSVPKEQHDRADLRHQLLIRPGKAPPQQNQNDNGFNEQLSTIPNATPQLISHNVNVEATDGKFQRTLLPTKPNVAEVKNRLTAIYADKANDSTSSSSTSQTVTSALSISTPAVTTQTTSSSSIVSQSSTTQRTQHRATTTPNFPACEPCGDSLKFQEQPTPILYSESANSNKTRLVEELPPMDNKLVAPISARISSASTGQTKNDETTAYGDETKSHTPTESQNWKNFESCEPSPQTAVPSPTEIATEVTTASAQPHNEVGHYPPDEQYMTYQEFLTKHAQVTGLNAPTRTSHGKYDQPVQKLETDSCANWVEMRCWAVLGIFIFFLYIYHLWLPQIMHCGQID